MTPALGHDDHQHETTQFAGCSGTVNTALLGGHPDGANLYYVLNARYTDGGGAGGSAPLTGFRQAILQPKHKQAEYFSSQSGIRVVAQAGAESGGRIGDISSGDWIAFTPMSLQNITNVTYRVSSPTGGGSIELRANSPTGTLLATTAVQNTGGWDTYQNTVTSNVAALTGGGHTLYMVFRPATANSFDVDAYTFGGPGVGTTPAGGVAGRTWTMQAQHSMKFADVNGVSTADGAAVHQWTATGANNQRWAAVDAGTGTVTLRAVHSGKCLDINGGGTNTGATLVQNTCDNGNDQKWRVTQTTTAGIYTVQSVHSGLCVDVNANSTADGALLIQWTCHTGNNQRWRFTQV
jgi:hypothetical protein